LTAVELVCVARTALRKLRNLDTSTIEQLVTDGDVLDEDHEATHDVNGRATSCSSFETGNTDEDQAHRLLRYCMKRLCAFHETDIRNAFRQEFSHEDLLFFLDNLRISLARGGWLSQYVEELPIHLEGGEQSGNRLSICTKLLSCAIDSLGTGGWVTNNSLSTNTGDTIDTITYLKAEISAALEGIEEAAYLIAMLNEVLLYSKTVKHWHNLPNTENSSVVKPITVSMESWEDQVLPIGLKADQSVGLTKTGAGGEIKERSMRDLGMLKSRKVGAYSFERILI